MEEDFGDSPFGTLSDKQRDNARLYAEWGT
jgi:hypothetical protein